MNKRCLMYCQAPLVFLLVWLVLYAYIRHAVLGGAESHDRRCRSSVVGYLYMSPSGALCLR